MQYELDSGFDDEKQNFQQSREMASGATHLFAPANQIKSQGNEANTRGTRVSQEFTVELYILYTYCTFIVPKRLQSSSHIASLVEITEHA